MPLYDYTCDDCDVRFEVSRSFADADIPALCPTCNEEARRELSVPMTTFTRGAAAEGLRQAPGRSDAARWSHDGHSHGPGTGAHSH